jgi:hypothetical protein
MGWSETWRSSSPSDLIIPCQCLQENRLDDTAGKEQNPTTTIRTSVTAKASTKLMVV